jgi:hypothetical protein
LTYILISKRFEKESSVLAWIRIRIEQKSWIRTKSIRIHILKVTNNFSSAIFQFDFIEPLRKSGRSRKVVNYNLDNLSGKGSEPAAEKKKKRRGRKSKDRAASDCDDRYAVYR